LGTCFEIFAVPAGSLELDPPIRIGFSSCLFELSISSSYSRTVSSGKLPAVGLTPRRTTQRRSPRRAILVSGVSEKDDLPWPVER
jgi:hypothetical protein